MDRKQLIERLVSRKLAGKGADKVFCVCLAGKALQTDGPQAAPKK